MTRDGETRVFGLIGDPVEHSLSPAMHAAAFRELGLDAEYRPLRVSAGSGHRVGIAMRRLAATGGGNITLPHKSRAAAALDRASEAVRLTGACNCFWLDSSGSLCGDNTDVGGIRAVIESIEGFEVVGSTVLVLGAGGAAAASVAAALGSGASRVVVRNRRPERAEELLARFDAERVALHVPEESPADFDLVIQATSLGLSPADPLPLEFTALGPNAVLDLVYRPGGTRWVRQAREQGIQAEDGLRVLLEQGVLSLERWLRIHVTESVRQAMRGALRLSGAG